MSDSTSSVSASTSLNSAQSSNFLTPEQAKTPPAKTTASKVKYPPAKTWAHNSKPTEIVDKPAHWTPGPFNPHRVSEDPKDRKVYVHIITHECLEGDAVRCVIKGVPAGSKVEANDYIRIGDIARLFLKQPATPPAIEPSKTKTWAKPGGNWPTAKSSWNGTGEPSWSRTGVWSTKPVFLTASSSRMPDMIITAETNSTMSLPTSSSSSSYSSASNSTVSVPTISSSSSSTTSSSFLTSSSLSMNSSSTFSTSFSLSTESSSMSLTIPCTKCDTTTTVSTTTTATAIILTTGPFNNSTTTLTVTATIVSPSTITSSSSSTNGTSSGPTGTPTWSMNTVMRSRPNTMTIISPSNGWPVRTETAKRKKKYFTKDTKGHLHHNFFTESSEAATITKRGEPESTSTERSWSHVMQKNFLEHIAKLPNQAFDLILKTHAKTTVEPTATDVEAASNFAEGIMHFMETATPFKPTPISSPSPEETASLSAEIYSFMQTAVPLAEGEFFNPNNPSIKALTATAEAPKYTLTRPFPHGDIVTSGGEHGISRQAFVGIWCAILVLSLMGMAGSGWAMVKRRRAIKAAKEVEAMQKLGY